MTSTHGELIGGQSKRSKAVGHFVIRPSNRQEQRCIITGQNNHLQESIHKMVSNGHQRPTQRPNGSKHDRIRLNRALVTRLGDIVAKMIGTPGSSAGDSSLTLSSLPFSKSSSERVSRSEMDIARADGIANSNNNEGMACASTCPNKVNYQLAQMVVQDTGNSNNDNIDNGDDVISAMGNSKETVRCVSAMNMKQSDDTAMTTTTLTNHHRKKVCESITHCSSSSITISGQALAMNQQYRREKHLINSDISSNIARPSEYSNSGFRKKKISKKKKTSDYLLPLDLPFLENHDHQSSGTVIHNSMNIYNNEDDLGICTNLEKMDVIAHVNEQVTLDCLHSQNMDEPENEGSLIVVEKSIGDSNKGTKLWSQSLISMKKQIKRGFCHNDKENNYEDINNKHNSFDCNHSNNNNNNNSKRDTCNHDILNGIKQDKTFSRCTRFRSGTHNNNQKNSSDHKNRKGTTNQYYSPSSSATSPVTTPACSASSVSSSSQCPSPSSCLYLLLSTILALVFIFCTSNPRMSLVASGMRLGPNPQANSQPQASSEQAADLNAAILATMSNQNQPEAPQGSRTNNRSVVGSFKLGNSPTTYRNNNYNNNQLEFNDNDNNNQNQLQLQTTSGGNFNNSNPASLDDLGAEQWLETSLTVGRIFIMGAIIIGDICGNSLVILSVCRHSKLRVTTNWFVVSLACADILVALFAMTFNASVIISGKWLFKPWVCDFWNSCDVLASTASILHLCCISIDRYIAITRPLDYPMKITTKRVMYALCVVWLSSALLSYLPIFTGIYTTSEHLEWLKDHPDQCEFVVNRVYAIVSSSISFWIPCCIMVFTYYRIYMEASRQEKLIHQAQNIMPAPMPNHHNHQHQSGNHASNAHHLGSGASAVSKQSAGLSDSSQGSAAARAKQRRSKSMAVTPSAAGASQNARIRQLAVAQQLQQFETKSATSSTNTHLHNQQQQLATTQLITSAPSTDKTTSADLNDPGSELADEKEPLNSTDIGDKADEQHQQQQEQLATAPTINFASSTSSSDNNNNKTTALETRAINNNQVANRNLNYDNNGKHFNVNNKNNHHNKDNFNLKTGNTNKNQQNKKKRFNINLNDGDQDDEFDDFDPRDPNSGQSTPTKRSISKMKREHKAAKTLGIIMGVFILCWLPFFSWYTPMHICGHACDGIIPHQVVTILFWIGYFNSTLNPIIYAYFNSEFRDAFKKTLQWIFCCCQDLKCLRVNRGHDNQHYNCTYRSTQEIVLVSNG